MPTNALRVALHKHAKAGLRTSAGHEEPARELLRLALAMGVEAQWWPVHGLIRAVHNLEMIERELGSISVFRTPRAYLDGTAIVRAARRSLALDLLAILAWRLGEGPLPV